MKRTEKFMELTKKLDNYLKNNIDVHHFNIVNRDDDFVWIEDSKNAIGNKNAHFEIYYPKTRNAEDKVYCDIHFEASKIENRNIFYDNLKGISTPDKINWLDWHKSKSLRYDDDLKIDDPDIAKKLMDGLKILSVSYGNEVNVIMKNHKLDKKSKRLNNNTTMHIKEIEVEYPASFPNHGQFQKDFYSVLGIPKNVKKVNVFYKGIKYNNLTLGSGSGRARIIFPKYGEKFIKNNPELKGGEKINIKVEWNDLESITNTKTDMTKNNKIFSPLNQILFGPPGTGKTFNTVSKAIEIINPEFDLNQKRELVKDEFDRLIKEGQIVFTTFHQSMNYEDFIEGIKPIEPDKEGDPVIYRIELGIFRKFCIEAAFAIAQLREDKTTKEVLDFSILYDNFADGIQERILNGDKVELKTKTGGTILVDSISQQGNFIIKHHDGVRTYTVSKARLSKLQSAIKNLDDVSNINDQFREVIGGSNSSAYWAVLNAIRIEKPPKPIDKKNRVYTPEEKKRVVDSLSKSDYKNKNAGNYVLIIDEINRGNVSQIFGELITLIEKDKRLGKDEDLEITLPYSKEKFGVPPNLFILGTMNTADRSVEALDAALRRRFSFVEMPPYASLIVTDGKLKEENGVIEKIDLPLVLNTMNNRIEKLLDKDHKIGHSYFMSVSKLYELKDTFQNEIIPLLQEYFFGDYGKIGLVLGKEFLEPMENGNEILFADMDEYDASEFEERTIFRVKNINKISDDDFKNAISELLKKKDESE